MTINQFRSVLYRAAKILGHVQAAKKSARTGSLEPIVRRAARVQAGKLTARLLGALFARR